MPPGPQKTEIGRKRLPQRSHRLPEKPRPEVHASRPESIPRGAVRPPTKIEELKIDKAFENLGKTLGMIGKIYQELLPQLGKEFGGEYTREELAEILRKKLNLGYEESKTADEPMDLDLFKMGSIKKLFHIGRFADMKKMDSRWDLSEHEWKSFLSWIFKGNSRTIEVLKTIETWNSAQLRHFVLGSFLERFIPPSLVAHEPQVHAREIIEVGRLVMQQQRDISTGDAHNIAIGFMTPFHSQNGLPSIHDRNLYRKIFIRSEAEPKFTVYNLIRAADYINNPLKINSVGTPKDLKEFNKFAEEIVGNIYEQSSDIEKEAIANAAVNVLAENKWKTDKSASAKLAFRILKTTPERAARILYEEINYADNWLSRIGEFLHIGRLYKISQLMKTFLFSFSPLSLLNFIHSLQNKNTNLIYNLTKTTTKSILEALKKIDARQENNKLINAQLDLKRIYNLWQLYENLGTKETFRKALEIFKVLSLIRESNSVDSNQLEEIQEIREKAKRILHSLLSQAGIHGKIDVWAQGYVAAFMAATLRLDQHNFEPHSTIKTALESDLKGKKLILALNVVAGIIEPQTIFAALKQPFTDAYPGADLETFVLRTKIEQHVSFYHADIFLKLIQDSPNLRPSFLKAVRNIEFAKLDRVFRLLKRKLKNRGIESPYSSWHDVTNLFSENSKNISTILDSSEAL